MDTSHRSMRLVMLPWLAHGHISPFLELAKGLSTRNFVIYMCSTSINLDSIRQKLSEKDTISIKLVELQLPSMADLPPHYHTTNGLPPHLMPFLKQAFDMAKPCFSNILLTLKPDLVIYDFLQPWAPSVALSHHIPAVLFLTTGATMMSYLSHKRWKAGSDFPFPAIYDRDCEEKKYPSSANEGKDREKVFACVAQSSDIILIKTWREIEAKYIDYFSELCGKKIVPVGPLVHSQCAVDDNDDKQHNEIIEWLNKKERGSTVFASFGSEYFLTKEEIEEIALALELSGVNLVWVVRFPSGEDMKVEEALPRGFLDRVGERAMVVKGWAPQGRILRHESIGGFLNHCGWSSVMEGIKYGKPILAMPMHLDQPMNAKFVEEVGVGKEIVRDMEGKFDVEEVARLIRMVVVGKCGKDVRRKVKELSEKMVAEGEEEIDVAVEEIVKLCRKTERHDSMEMLYQQSYVTCL